MKYTKEFKEEALKLSDEIDVRKAAEQLGLKYNTLTDWRKHRREEETSYHYAPASDYIEVKNADTVSCFIESVGLPFVKGKTWTTDAFYRETRANFEKRKADGCLLVEMECAGVQAMCDFRELNAYFFFTSGDLLDGPKWDARRKNNETKHTQHDSNHFDIALELARYVAD